MNGTHFLHNVPMLAHLSNAQLEPLAQRMIARKYRSGEEIFRQGSPGNSMYIVKSGLVQVVVKDAEGGQQVLAHFGPGQVFGEFALLDGLPRSAGAVACERSELMILTRPEFFIYLEQNPAVAINLLVLVSRRLRFTLQRAEHLDPHATPLVLLARTLLGIVERYAYEQEGKYHLAVRLTRGELAGLVGCSRTEAENAMHTLEQKGLVDMHGLQMVIHDLDGLRVLALMGND